MIVNNIIDWETRNCMYEKGLKRSLLVTVCTPLELMSSRSSHDNVTFRPIGDEKNAKMMTSQKD